MSLMIALRPLVFGALLASLAAPALAASGTAKKPVPSASSSAVAPVELIEETDSLKINWTTGQITITGMGVPGDRGPLAYRRTLSTRAALADAYRRLAGSLDLVRIDANTRLRDLAITDDTLRARLNDYVKQAKILETNSWPDGSTEIVLAAELKGANSLSTLLAPPAAPQAAATQTAIAEPTPSATAPTKEVVTAPIDLKATYSSVILDARTLGAQPAVLPNLRDGDGKVVALGEKGDRLVVKYLRDGADMDSQAGLNPLKLKAQRTQGLLKADLVLTSESADALKKALLNKKLDGKTPVIVVL